MYLHIFFTPAEMAPIETSVNDIYIVIDVIRATTTMAVVFDQGAARAYAAENIEQAWEGRRQFPGRLLCGERNVQPLPGFDYGNSPVQFSQLDLTGRELIHTTTNGTRAFYACPDGSIRLAGSFYNAQAVTSRALAMTRERNSDISLVCAGEFGYFALDDAVCAGYVALEIQRQYAEYFQGIPLLSHESVDAAIALYEAYKPPKVLAACRSAQSVILGGLPDDPPFCMQTSMSSSVPMVVGREGETGLLVIERV